MSFDPISREFILANGKRVSEASIMSIEYDAQAALGPQKAETERNIGVVIGGPVPLASGRMQTFATGATRSASEGKNDYSGFLNPRVLREFGDYMRSHQIQADGQKRSSRNWQKGITQDAYMESFLRHAVDLWLLHEGNPSLSPDDGHLITKREACCALMFNVMGYLLEELKK